MFTLIKIWIFARINFTIIIRLKNYTYVLYRRELCTVFNYFPAQTSPLMHFQRNKTEITLNKTNDCAPVLTQTEIRTPHQSWKALICMLKTEFALLQVKTFKIYYWASEVRAGPVSRTVWMCANDVRLIYVQWVWRWFRHNKKFGPNQDWCHEVCLNKC